ncbi:hypothetical protein OAV26_00305 [Crocinitomicaceae bacterium]|nr:hypothetical protein [Crocinitomicaceae bacterium]
MKTTKFKFALLFTAMTFSAYVSGQQDEITNGITSNSSLNELKVKIYQNPENPGNIKIAWKVNTKIDQIRMHSKYNDKEWDFYVKNQNNLEVNNLENGTYFVWFYLNDKVVGTEQVKVKLQKKDDLDFNAEQKDHAPNNFNAFNALKVKIYPNPSTTGNVKMEWANEQQIDQIIILSQGEDNKLNFYVKKQNELTVDGLENGKYFVRFYSQNKLKGIRQIKVMKF